MGCRFPEYGGEWKRGAARPSEQTDRGRETGSDRGVPVREGPRCPGVRESAPTMKPRLHLLAHLPPLPGTGGGQLRSFATLEALSRRFTVTLLTFQRPGLETGCLSALEPYCEGGIHSVPLPRSRHRDIGLAVAGWCSPTPWRIARDSSHPMRRLAASLIARERPVAVHIDHLPMAQFLPPLAERHGARAVLDLHNAEHRLFASMLPYIQPWALPLLRHDVARLARYTSTVAGSVDHIVVLTPEDREAVSALRAVSTPPVTVVPVGLEIPPVGLGVPQCGPWRLATVATLDWIPNTDGLEWFAWEVWPRLRRLFPDLVWDIAGVRGNRRVARLRGIAGIQVHGKVASVGEFLEGTAVFLAPVRCGAGIRIKVLDAMARGLPVVTTPLGAEGIAPQCPCVVATSPESWIDAIRALLEDESRRRRLSDEGRVAVRRWHGREVTTRAWNCLYDRVLGVEGRAD